MDFDGDRPNANARDQDRPDAGSPAMVLSGRDNLRLRYRFLMTPQQTPLVNLNASAAD